MRAAGLYTARRKAKLTTDDEDRLTSVIRDGAQDTVNQVGQQIVQRQVHVAPTVTIRPGFSFRVIASRDLILERYSVHQ